MREKSNSKRQRELRQLASRRHASTNQLRFISIEITSRSAFVRLQFHRRLVSANQKIPNTASCNDLFATALSTSLATIDDYRSHSHCVPTFYDAHTRAATSLSERYMHRSSTILDLFHGRFRGPRAASLCRTNVATLSLLKKMRSAGVPSLCPSSAKSWSFSSLML